MSMWDTYFSITTPVVKEGGAARDTAFLEHLKNKVQYLYSYRKKNGLARALDGAKIINQLKKCRDRKILFHYSAMRYVFGERILGSNLGSKVVCGFIKHVSMRNIISIEVNDLPYEQALSLKLKPNTLYNFDKNLFRLGRVKFIFASSEMMKYVVENYSVESAQCSYIVNGAPLLAPRRKRASNKLRYVYAGSLNKGRQIQLLLNLFKGLESKLYLMGSDGAWVKSLCINYKNIIYMGSLDESKAHKLVSVCDCGLIPYDNQEFYYNLAFPTKASFFITAGIPFVSTPTKELMNHFSDDVAYFRDLNEWADLIKSIDTDEIALRKQKINTMRNKYVWESIFNEYEESYISE